MEWDDVLTKSQKDGVIERAVITLTALVGAKAAKELLKEVHLGSHASGHLYLTDKGLVVKTSTYMTDMAGSKEYRSSEDAVKEADFPAIVERYCLTGEKLGGVLSRIEAKP